MTLLRETRVGGVVSLPLLGDEGPSGSGGRNRRVEHRLLAETPQGGRDSEEITRRKNSALTDRLWAATFLRVGDRVEEQQ